ncbi:GGDEF domain-containing protein, partial [Kitasatospora phosalacinea]|uniref:GGDEF domain-containing protein n=1 Tax=Kitasatospora phosalacinea TaxID=2065 RepID=UPI0035D5F38B
LLTHVEDIEDRKRHELQLAHRASHDALTGLPNGAELRARLARRLCPAAPPPAGIPGQAPPGAPHQGAHAAPDGRPAAEAPAPLAHGYAAPDGALERDRAAFAAGEVLQHTGVTAHHVHAVVPAEQPPGDLWHGHRRGAPTGERGLAVLYCDLDGFKLVNDRHGHNTGDAVLIEIARRLQQVVREGDTVARMSGDEFVVLADNIGREEAKELAGRLRGAILPPMRIDNRAVRVGVSLGIGWAGCGMSIDEVLHSADERMYDEKRTRGGAARGSRGERSHRRAG